MTAQRLAEFLLERIAEDETVARAAAWGEEKFLSWELREWYGTLDVLTVATEGTSPKYAQPIPITCDSEGLSDSVVTREAGAHIARFDPARILRECKAKRTVLRGHLACGTGIGACDDGGHAWEADEPGGPGCADLATAAAVYDDHPDFRPEWAL